MPANPDCKRCGGTGHIYVDSMNAKRCICLQRDLYARKLGMHLYKVPPAKNSPYLKKLRTNMFMVVADEDINPHLKSAFITLGLNAHWAYVTDTDVLQAFLGNPNSLNAQNVAEIAEIPFIVLRLGVQGYKNIALSGQIVELLMTRLLSHRTTWIISPRPLPENCLEYSDELDNMLRRHFESNVWTQRREQDHLREAREARIKEEVENGDWEEDILDNDIPPVADIMPEPKKESRKGRGNENSRTNDIIKSFRLGSK